MKMDAETMKQLQEGEKLIAWANSDGWRLVKIKIFEKIKDIESVMGLESRKHEDLVSEIGARQIAVETLLGVVSEIEGEADQATNNKEILMEDNSIKRY